MLDLSGGKPATVYLVRPNQVGQVGRIVADEASYAKARESVIAYWKDRLSRGAKFDVPEPEVMNAGRSLLIQNLNMGRWYSIGNFYQTSFTEQYNALKTLGDYGFPDLERRLNEELMGFTQGGQALRGGEDQGDTRWQLASLQRWYKHRLRASLAPGEWPWRQRTGLAVGVYPRRLLTRRRKFPGRRRYAGMRACPPGNGPQGKWTTNTSSPHPKGPS